MTSALLDLGQSYTTDAEVLTLAAIARRHEGVPGPAWLLPVAIARSGRAMIDDTRLLATEAGVTSDLLGAIEAYVTMAAELLAARPVDVAIEVATGKPAAAAAIAVTHAASDDAPDRPRLCGIGPVDAVATGIWALSRPGANLAGLAASLAHWCEPWIAAAAAGLLGLRDGCAAVPAQWYREVAAASTCLELAEHLHTESPTASYQPTSPPYIEDPGLLHADQLVS